MFLTKQTAQAEAGSLICQAQVCTASQYNQAEGDDVFVCKYEYNMANQVSYNAFPQGACFCSKCDLAGWVTYA